jgi:large subunit ribosomal protein L22
VANLIKKLPVNMAVKQLAFSQKRSGPALTKLLKSAINNAKNNFRLNPDNLYVKELKVDEGPVFKRYIPRARGRATIIRKRSSHITLVLDEFQPKAGPPRAEKIKKKVKK